MARLLLLLLALNAACGGSPDDAPPDGGGGRGGEATAGATTSGGGGSSGVGGSGGGGGGGGEGPTDACLAIAASNDAALNRSTIQGCLDAPAGYAGLEPGATYSIDASLIVDAGDVLEGIDPKARSVVQPAAASAPFATSSNAIVNVVNSTGGDAGGTMRNVKIDMRDARPAGSTIYGVRVAYDKNRVENVEITSTPMPWREVRAISLYFGTGYENLADGVDIHHAGLGVVFVNGNTEAMSPWVDHAVITDNRGDSVTFAGYGKLTNSVIARNGYDDGDSGSGTRLPPGGALYASYVNQEGGWIENNEVSDSCGTNLELNMTRNFTVLGNHFFHPGWPGKNGSSSPIGPGELSYDVPADFCKAAMTALVIATRDSVFQGNVITNHDRAANTSASTSNGGSEMWFGPSKTDLPSPDGTSIGLAFVLGKGHADTMGDPHYAVHNVFKDNHFAATSGGLGIGWFAGRGTGFGPGGVWDPATTANVFDDNSHCDPSGACSAAPHTVRCGDNRYATGTPSCGGPGGNAFDGVGKGNACNRDDFTHEGAGHDARRNDLCYGY